VLLARYGGGFAERLNAMFEAAGLPFTRKLDKVPNSRRALALGELARDRGVLDALHPRLFDAYWARGRDLGDPEVLREEGTAAGLEAAEIEGALENPGYLQRVAEQTDAALEFGASGVPAWLIDDRYLVPGAQPHDVFDHVLGRFGYEPGAGA
jgi:predicted DsbA family dithiol-disulfide isomerase